MNHDNMSTPQKQECPYFFYLTRKLEHELEHERKLRMEAQTQNKPFRALGLMLLVVLAMGITFCFAYGNMDAEVLEACVHLTRACVALFFSLGFALMAVNITLNDHAKRKNAAKKEG